MKPLILCLGNEIISDDGFGFKIADLLREKGEVSAIADVTAAAIAGFALLDLLNGRDRVLIVDTIQTQRDTPGTIRILSASDPIPTVRLMSNHQINLPVALRLGENLGYTMPTTVDILTVEAEDLVTLSEGISESVRNALPVAVQLIEEWIDKDVAAVR